MPHSCLPPNPYDYPTSVHTGFLQSLEHATLSHISRPRSMPFPLSGMRCGKQMMFHDILHLTPEDHCQTCVVHMHSRPAMCLPHVGVSVVPWRKCYYLPFYLWGNQVSRGEVMGTRPPAGRWQSQPLDIHLTPSLCYFTVSTIFFSPPLPSTFRTDQEHQKWKKKKKKNTEPIKNTTGYIP